MSTVGQLLLQRQFHEFLGRWGHILKSLTERNNGKAHTLKVLYHLDSSPAVKGNFSNIEAFSKSLDEFLDVTVMDDISFGGLQKALSFPDVVRDMVSSDSKLQRIR